MKVLLATVDQKYWEGLFDGYSISDRKVEDPCLDDDKALPLLLIIS